MDNEIKTLVPTARGKIRGHFITRCRHQGGDRSFRAGRKGDREIHADGWRWFIIVLEVVGGCIRGEILGQLHMLPIDLTIPKNGQGSSATG